jgi:hypothetical protein
MTAAKTRPAAGTAKAIGGSSIASVASLRHGDRRTIGSAASVARKAAGDPDIARELVDAMESDDAGLAMRSADALEKASRTDPAIIQPHRTTLLRLIRSAQQPEVQWHLAQLIEHLELTRAQQASAFAALKRYFDESESRIVQSSALQAMVNLGAGNSALAARARQVLETALHSEAPSVAARARKLRSKLE